MRLLENPMRRRRAQTIGTPLKLSWLHFGAQRWGLEISNIPRSPASRRQKEVLGAMKTSGALEISKRRNRDRICLIFNLLEETRRLRRVDYGS